MHVVRPLARSDSLAVVTALADAFLRDDLARWIYAEPKECHRRHSEIFKFLVEDAFSGGQTMVDVADDCSGAAIWAPPGSAIDRSPPPAAREEVVEAFTGVYNVRPAEPHWYLEFLGARVPGTGLGSALIAVGLARADTSQLPAALFTGSAANLPFYQRHGFRELHHLSFNGIEVWWMWRAPARG